LKFESEGVRKLGFKRKGREGLGKGTQSGRPATKGCDRLARSNGRTANYRTIGTGGNSCDAAPETGALLCPIILSSFSPDFQMLRFSPPLTGAVIGLINIPAFGAFAAAHQGG